MYPVARATLIWLVTIFCVALTGCSAAKDKAGVSLSRYVGVYKTPNGPRMTIVRVDGHLFGSAAGRNVRWCAIFIPYARGLLSTFGDPSSYWYSPLLKYGPDPRSTELYFVDNKLWAESPTPEPPPRHWRGELIRTADLPDYSNMYGIDGKTMQKYSCLPTLAQRLHLLFTKPLVVGSQRDLT
jgi:hypothetical protein